MARKMQRPTLDGMWGALEGRFTKFIAGEDGNSSSTSSSLSTMKPSSGSDTIGPFSHYSAITPDATSGGVSRVQSYADFGGGPVNSQPTSRAGSAMDFHTRRAASPKHRSSSAMGLRHPLRDPYSEWPPSSQSQSQSQPGVRDSSFSFAPQGEVADNKLHQGLRSENMSEMSDPTSYDGPYQSEGPTNNAPWYGYESTPAGGETGGEDPQSPVDAPYYGYQPHGAQKPQFVSNIGAELSSEDGSGFVSPMDALSRVPSSYTASQPHTAPAQRQTFDEADEDDDLGLGNSRSRRKSADGGSAYESKASAPPKEESISEVPQKPGELRRAREEWLFA